MVDLNILSYSKEELINYLRYSAGSSIPRYFGAITGGGLELQQIPEEYAELLLWFSNMKFKSYLELGVGKGGSFLLNTLFQPFLEKAHCIDNCLYYADVQRHEINKKIEYLKQIRPIINVQFFDGETDSLLKGPIIKGLFDCIFIDADHSYEGCKKDFENSLFLLQDTGYLIFHDINSMGAQGVVKFWSEIKNPYCLELIHSNTCGIGIYKRPPK